MPDGPNLSGFSAFKFSQSFSGEPLEATLRDVMLDLPIPRLPVVLEEPATEQRELVRRQFFNFTLESFNLRHISWKSTTLPTYSRRLVSCHA